MRRATPPWPGPPPGPGENKSRFIFAPLPRHDCGPIAYQLRKYEGGCVLIYDRDNRIVQAIPCRTVDDLREWDASMLRWEQGHRT